MIGGTAAPCSTCTAFNKTSADKVKRGKSMTGNGEVNAQKDDDGAVATKSVEKDTTTKQELVKTEVLGVR
jgi:hypothetical protein